jgi:hypothetical protein
MSSVICCDLLIRKDAVVGKLCGETMLWETMPAMITIIPMMRHCDWPA